MVTKVTFRKLQKRIERENPTFSVVPNPSRYPANPRTALVCDDSRPAPHAAGLQRVCATQKTRPMKRAGGAGSRPRAGRLRGLGRENRKTPRLGRVQRGDDGWMNTNRIPTEWLAAAGIDPATQLFIIEFQLGNLAKAYYVSSTPHAGPMQAAPGLSPKEAFDEYVKSWA